ncbi:MULTISPECIES: enoyl-CoA hydratase/isomerase family protein [Streptacidiphilus]|uniref:Enoyl-CoA hydratase/isomerase family protein n=1 Tax=Streptacidiphilus cavernicola TaxID=3342716 RepID=A0ABV6UJ42_9ACTN|nr:enoyl-CoA hydratase/isomerase family protein [Streptacidiphilus jeojiense]
MPTTISLDELAAGAAHTPLLAEGGAALDPLLLVDLDAGGPDGGTAVLRRAVERAGECDRLLVGITAREPASLPDTLVEALDLTLARTGAGAGAGVGVGDGGDRRVVAVDDPAAEARTLHANVLAHPQAALVLGRLLRVGPRLTVGEALDAESLAYSTLLGGQEFADWLAARGDRPAPPPAAAETVLVRRKGDTLHLTLNRPERRNAHGRELRDALVEALRIAEADDSVTAVVLDGNGPCFCSGGDLAEFGTAPDLATAHLVRTRGGAAAPLHRLRERITVLVHGSCVGAGIELPAFAGRVVADPDAWFLLPELGMGLIPGAGGTVSIPRRIGRWRTLHLVLSGAPIGAERALDWGLVDRIERIG